MEITRCIFTYVGNFCRLYPGGGGGGTQMLFGRGCAAEAAKPVPIFKGHFGGKGYPLLGVWRKRVPIIRGFYSRKLRFCVL